MTPLGLGIVGTGNIAGGYARDAATHPEIRLVSVTDLDAARATAFAAEHGCRAHGSLDDLLADPEVDIVVNLTVHHAHYEVTRRALEAGRHVYSEKPLALTGAEAHELADAGSVTGPASWLLAIDLPRRGAADGCRMGPAAGDSARCGPSTRRSLGPDRALASGPGAVLRRRRPRRCRGLPADTGHLDARAGPLGPSLGLGPDARQGRPSTAPRSGSAART